MSETWQVVQQIDPRVMEMNPRSMDYVRQDIRRKLVDKVADILADGENHVVRILTEERRNERFPNGYPPSWPTHEIVGRIEVGTVRYREFEMYRMPAPPIELARTMYVGELKETTISRIASELRRRISVWQDTAFPVPYLSPSRSDYVRMRVWMRKTAKRIETFVKGWFQ